MAYHPITMNLVKQIIQLQVIISHELTHHFTAN
jgi:hypothetical protein